MRVSRNRLAMFYVVIGVSAWVLTSLHLPTYISAGFVAGTEAFWRDALFQSSAAGKFLAVDISMLALAVLIWMLTEARERSMRGISVYILVGLFIGISLAVPLFLAARERNIAMTQPERSQLVIRGSDAIWIGLLILLSLGASALTF